MKAHGYLLGIVKERSHQNRKPPIPPYGARAPLAAGTTPTSKSQLTLVFLFSLFPFHIDPFQLLGHDSYQLSNNESSSAHICYKCLGVTPE